MFVCVMFASHPTIVVHILLIRQIRLCLQCITGAVRLAPVRSKSRWLCRFPVYQHAITFDKFSAISLPRQIFCEKSTRRSNGQTTWFEEVTWFSLPCASILNCHTILSHHFVTPFRDFSVLCCFSFRCFDFANGSKRVARVRSTSGRDGRFYQKHKLNCQINC